MPWKGTWEPEDDWVGVDAATLNKANGTVTPSNISTRIIVAALEENAFCDGFIGLNWNPSIRVPFESLAVTIGAFALPCIIHVSHGLRTKTRWRTYNRSFISQESMGVAGVAMNAYAVKYGFSQAFNVSAKRAFDWCTDYKPSDLALMKEKGERRIQKLTDDTVIMTETVHKAGMSITKKKLVRLNKPNLSWTNTHVSGPNLYSQFLYERVSVGKNGSRLNFTGLLICYSKTALSKRTLSRMAASERRGDSRAWRHLAAAMTADLS